MKRLLKITILTYFVLFIFTLSSQTCFAQASNIIDAKSMVVIETGNNRVLYSQNENEKLALASTTKIATAITVIENCKDLNEIIKIKKEYLNVEGTSIYLKADEEWTVKELLYGLMLQSGNDAANVLAQHISGSYIDFCATMNSTMQKIGANDSNFVNPHGLDNKEHYSTAKDLAIITSYALKNDTFKEIVSSKSYEIKDNGTRTYRKFVNKNRLLHSLSGCIGVKTGYTSKAGRCLVSACERNGMQVVCVVLNCGPMFERSVELIERAFSEYKNYEILESYNCFTEIPVKDGDKSFIKIFNKNGFNMVLNEKERELIRVEYDFPNYLTAPVKREQIIGTIKIYNDKELIFSENIYTIDKVESLDIKSKLSEILSNW